MLSIELICSYNPFNREEVKKNSQKSAKLVDESIREITD